MVPRCTSSGRRRPSFATTIRLMAGAGLLTEGFQEGQVGSSAMPHKVERAQLRADLRILHGPRGLRDHDRLARGRTSGTRATSPARSSAGWRCRTRSSRSTGSLETLLTVLEQMEVFPAAIAQRERAQPALPGDDHDPDGGGQARRRPRDGARGDQGARAGCRKGHALGGGTADLLGRLAGDRRIGLGKKALLGNPGGKRALRRAAPGPGGRVCRGG